MNTKNLFELSDEEIAAYIVKHKDVKSFSILYDRYAGKVFGKCLQFAKNQEEAEDLAHDIFLRVYLKLKDFKANAKFSTWLYSVTYNYCVDFVASRRKTKENQEEYLMELSIQDDAYDKELFQIKVDHLKILLEKINPEDRVILLMKYQDDFPIKEIAQITDLSESAVKMRLKRTKAKIVELSQI